jgi:DNA invertase Pin-like site-specific DNA recombinase
LVKSKADRKPKTVAYLRVSTIDQDTEKNKHEILKLANDKDFGKVEFIEEKVSGKKSWKERKIKQIIDDLKEGDRLIVPELSRLGRSMLEIMEMLSIAKDR